MVSKRIITEHIIQAGQQKIIMNSNCYYKNKKDKTFPPGYNLYTRLLAETGLIGFMLFMMLLYFSLKETLNIMKRVQNEEKILTIIILITLLGLYINWLQIDTFRMYVVWLSLAILIRIEI